MARGLNKVMLIGHIGQPLEVKTARNGMVFARTSVATNSQYKDQQGKLQEQPQWHRIVFFGKLAEIASQYLDKGTQVYVEGEIRYDKYTGKDGVERTATEIIANQMQLLGSRVTNDSRPIAKPNPFQPARLQPAKPSVTDHFDDDIPF